MKEFIGECRYGQFGCDFILVRYYGEQHRAVDSLNRLCCDMSGGDDEASCAAENLLKLKDLGFVEIIELKDAAINKELFGEQYNAEDQKDIIKKSIEKIKQEKLKEDLSELHDPFK